MTLSARRPVSTGRKALILSGATLAVLAVGGAATASAGSFRTGSDRIPAMDCSGETASGKGTVITVLRGETVLVRGSEAVRTRAGQEVAVGEGETLEVRQDEAVLTLNNKAWRIEAGGTLQVREGDIVATFKDGKQLTTAGCPKG
jgi:hypothetical protein